MSTDRNDEPKKPRKPRKVTGPKPDEAPAPKQGYRIIGLKAENIKRLVLVDIKPDPGMNYVTGPNGSGKSSLLDAIWYTLLGKAAIPKSGVLRKGTKDGVVQLEFEDFVVTRKFRVDGDPKGYLEILNKPDRSRKPDPQTFLKSVLNYFSFDPLEFKGMEAEEQLETLYELNPTSAEEIKGIDARNKQDYDERRALTRDREQHIEPRLKAALGLKPGDLLTKKLREEIAETIPSKPVDASALLAEVQAAGNTNMERLAAIRKMDELRNAEMVERKAGTAALERANELMDEVIELKRKADVHVADADAMAENRRAVQVPDAVDTEDLERRIRSAQATNEKVELRRQMEEKLAAEDALTRSRDERLAERVRIIAEAKMPLPGLSYGEAEVLYNGIPFAALSDGEQIRVSVALAMAANPTVRVMRIKDGSLLDANGRKQIEAMAEEHDYQVWMELVSDTGGVGFVMEEGEVVSGE